MILKCRCPIQARKVIGNSVIVPVIQAIASEIFKVFQNKLRHNVYNLN